MNVVKVSIIIPVYKKEKYLTECIESILNQTFSCFELICINDCSPDSCPSILREFEKKDSRIRIINNKQNKGAAYARNIGIENAVGEYVLILDADDLYDKELVRLAYNKCKEERLDVAFWDFAKYNMVTEKTVNYTMPLPMKEKCKSRVFSNWDIKDFSFQLCVTGPWLKMYKREFLLSSGIWFQNLSSSNDVFFSKMCFVKAERIAYLENSLVKYRINAGFQISNDKSKQAVDFINAMLAIKEKMSEEKIYKRNVKSFNTYAFSTVLMHFFGAEIGHRKKMYEDIKQGLYVLFGKEGGSAVFLNQHYLYWMQDFVSIPVDQHEQCAVNNEYKYIVKYESDKIENLNRYMEEAGCKVALWGYGKNGKSLAEEWKKHYIRLDCIVDSNYVSFADDDIMSPDVLKDEKYIIMVPTAAFVEDILKIVSNMNCESAVVDMQSYFVYGFDLEKCIFERMNKSVEL